MSYCPVTFFSPHTYTKIFDNLPSSQTAGPELSAPTSPQEYLRVSGLVFKNGTVEFDPIFHFTSASPPHNPPPGAAYCLELRSSSALLAQSCFDLPFTAVDTGAPIDVDSFMIHLPLVGGAAKVILTRQGQPSRPGTRQRSCPPGDPGCPQRRRHGWRPPSGTVERQRQRRRPAHLPPAFQPRQRCRLDPPGGRLTQRPDLQPADLPHARDEPGPPARRGQRWLPYGCR